MRREDAYVLRVFRHAERGQRAAVPRHDVGLSGLDLPGAGFVELQRAVLKQFFSDVLYSLVSCRGSVDKVQQFHFPPVPFAVKAPC